MIIDNLEESDRTSLDIFHFGLAFAGFLVSVSGVLMSLPGWALGGLALLGWGVAYFETH